MRSVSLVSVFINIFYFKFVYISLFKFVYIITVQFVRQGKVSKDSVSISCINYLNIIIEVAIRNKCSVPGCVNTSQNTKMHRFANPNNYDRYKKWIAAINNKELEVLPAEVVYNYYLVCHNHFESSNYTRNGRLYHWSLPTLNLPSLGILLNCDICYKNLYYPYNLQLLKICQDKIFP